VSMEADAPPRVLVVEDDQSIARLIVKELGFDGFIVDAVANGAEGLESLAEYQPDAMSGRLGAEGGFEFWCRMPSRAFVF
jgi:DNA-binding response OmpR family regulator